MTPPPRLLLVDDDELTLKLLVLLFQREWPDARIDTATTVAGGLALIEAAGRARASYDIAILDFVFPSSEGQDKEVDVTLCEAVLTWSPQTPVAHITGHPKDPKVLEHLAAVHTPRRPSGFVISKASDYADELLQKTCECIYGARIEAAYDELFGRLTSGPHHDALAIHLGELCRDLAAAWPYLDQPLRSKLRTRLDIDDSNPSAINVDLR